MGAEPREQPQRHSPKWVHLAHGSMLNEKGHRHKTNRLSRRSGFRFVLAARWPTASFDSRQRSHPQWRPPTPLAVSQRNTFEYHNCSLDLFVLVAEIDEHLENIHVSKSNLARLRFPEGKPNGIPRRT